MLPSIVFVRHCVVLTLFAHLANVESSHTAASRARLSMASYCSCLCLLCFMHAYIRVLILYYVFRRHCLPSCLIWRCEKKERSVKRLFLSGTRCDQVLVCASFFPLPYIRLFQVRFYMSFHLVYFPVLIDMFVLISPRIGPYFLCVAELGPLVDHA